MLDPRQQQKGGFGAFAAREHEREELRNARNAVLGPDAAADAKPDAGDATKSDAVSAADDAADGTAKR